MNTIYSCFIIHWPIELSLNNVKVTKNHNVMLIQAYNSAETQISKGLAKGTIFWI